MMVGDVKAAFRLLSDTERGGVLSLDSINIGCSVKNILLDKHPPAQPPNTSLILSDFSSSDFHPILFDSISPELIRSVALKIGGSSGPLGLDAADWKYMSTSFCSSSTDLCSALSSFGRRLYTWFVDPVCLDAFLASPLITINKHPGIHPVGMGDRLCSILGKAILQVIHPDVFDAAGSSQLCAGQAGDCEAAVHAV